jgi:ABC-type uncharacterized transport system YnjBCD permease subunit
MKRSKQVAAPLLASAALTLLSATPIYAMSIATHRHTWQAERARDKPAPERLAATVQRSGFGTWFLFAAAKGVAIALAAGE